MLKSKCNNHKKIRKSEIGKNIPIWVASPKGRSSRKRRWELVEKREKEGEINTQTDRQTSNDLEQLPLPKGDHLHGKLAPNPCGKSRASKTLICGRDQMDEGR